MRLDCKDGLTGGERCPPRDIIERTWRANATPLLTAIPCKEGIVAAHKTIRAGTQFNLLTVLGPAPSPYGRRLYRCRCSCGNERSVAATALKRGTTKSCGCLARDPVVRKSFKHGHSGSQVYKVWQQIKRRCLDSEHPEFRNYGGRGITICQRWKESVSAFIDDMGPRPKGWTVERIDNDGPYSPQNCRWASRLDQSRNTRRTVLIAFRGVLMPLADAAALSGLKYRTAHYRFKRGIPLELPKLRPTLYKPPASETPTG